MNSEEIMRAAIVMRNAADMARQATNNIDSTLERHQWFLDDWLNRFQSILEQRNVPE